MLKSPNPEVSNELGLPGQEAQHRDLRLLDRLRKPDFSFLKIPDIDLTSLKRDISKEAIGVGVAVGILTVVMLPGSGRVLASAADLFNAFLSSQTAEAANSTPTPKPYSGYCIQVITPAHLEANPNYHFNFPDPCSIPDGWIKDQPSPPVPASAISTPKPEGISIQSTITNPDYFKAPPTYYKDSFDNVTFGISPNDTSKGVGTAYQWASSTGEPTSSDITIATKYQPYTALYSGANGEVGIQGFSPDLTNGSMGLLTVSFGVNANGDDIVHPWWERINDLSNPTVYDNTNRRVVNLGIAPSGIYRIGGTRFTGIRRLTVGTQKIIRIGIGDAAVNPAEMGVYDFLDQNGMPTLPATKHSNNPSALYDIIMPNIVFNSQFGAASIQRTSANSKH